MNVKVYLKPKQSHDDALQGGALVLMRLLYEWRESFSQNLPLCLQLVQKSKYLSTLSWHSLYDVSSFSPHIYFPCIIYYLYCKAKNMKIYFCRS